MAHINSIIIIIGEAGFSTGWMPFLLQNQALNGTSFKPSSSFQNSIGT